MFLAHDSGLNASLPFSPIYALAGVLATAPPELGSVVKLLPK